MRRLPRLRLRHKLAVAMSVAALLPVVVASWVAVSVVLRSLESGLRQDTERQLHVGLNLLLRNVERLGQVAVQLSTSPELSHAMLVGPEQVEQTLAGDRSALPSSLVQVADDTGTIIAQRVIGGVGERFSGLGVKSGGPVLRAGLSYERRVTIVAVNDVLVVRAVAPIVDASYLLEGVVVVSVPLDAGFADKLKGALGTDVLIFAGGADGDPARQAMSTFVDRFGARVTGMSLSPALAEQVTDDHTLFSTATILGREYALGYAPLHNIAGDVVGMFAVAAPRAPVIDARRAATRSLALGAAGAFVFALGLAGLLSRRLTQPLARLHRGALAIARGDLDHELRVKASDEIGDLSQAFADMTDALKVNQRRLAARMREIVALHDAGRAVSSVLDTGEVLTTIVDSVARVFRARLAALWQVALGPDGEPVLTLGAVRADGEGDGAAARAASLEEIALAVARSRHGMRIAAAGDDPTWSMVASGARVSGSLIASPLERKGAVLGVVVVGRAAGAKAFGDAESDLLDTFGDQAATAIENAGLYQRLRAFNEELEAKVVLRTRELTEANGELGRALGELQETQAQLILSERLAGLGQLVASVAHEINSPSAAIRGSADAMADSLHALFEHVRALPEAGISGTDFERLRAALEDSAPTVATFRMSSPVKVRRRAKANAAELVALGVPEAAAMAAGRTLAGLEIELPEDAEASVDEAEVGEDLARAICRVIAAGADAGARAHRAELVSATVTDLIQIHKSANTIQNAIRRIQRIVGALKSYS
ncbi:MAG TPA: HAMP domain-containing protein, partial [Kofleriaceae bacterium]|nr:HAMP domain-containing protein [Kofleriaceae bacterium]